MLSQQIEMDASNSKIMNQIHKFNENFEKLQPKLTVAKQVNYMLSEKLSMKHQWRNVQYSRRECLEFVSVPHNVSVSDLEEKF